MAPTAYLRSHNALPLFVYVSILCFGEQDTKDAYMSSLVSVLGHIHFINNILILRINFCWKMTVTYMLRAILLKCLANLEALWNFASFYRKIEWNEDGYTWFVNQEVMKTWLCHLKFKLKHYKHQSSLWRWGLEIQEVIACHIVNNWKQ